MNALRFAPLVVAGVGLVSCADIRTPDGSGYKTAITFHARKGAPSLPASRPEDVKIIDSTKTPPAGLDFRQGLLVAPDYPTPEHPHVALGELLLRETVDWNVDVWEDPAFVARRNEALKRAAAERGATVLFRTGEQHPNAGQHNVYYQAVALSREAPAYPSVDEALGALKLSDDGYKEISRSTSRLADLGGRAPDKVVLKVGHTYAFAVVLHPGIVDMKLREDESLAFLVTVERDPYAYKHREGTFLRLDKPYPKRTWTPGVDGVFARAGAGGMEGEGEDVYPELVTRPATVQLARRSSKTHEGPIGEMGAGEADFIVFEKKVSPEEFTKAVCSHCENVAEACSKRVPLAGCAELQTCFREIEQPLATCAAAYAHI